MELKLFAATTAALLVLAGLLAFLAFPAFAETDPAAPGNLTAEIVDGGVALSWDAPTENADVVTGYQVIRRDPNEDGVGVFKTVENDTGDTETSYTDTTATGAGKSYTFRVKAWRGEALSDWSNYVRVDLPAEEEPTPTPAPTATPTPTPTPTPSPTPTATPEPEGETTGPLTGFTLVDASDQTALATLTDGGSVALDDPASGDYAVRADVESGSAIGSVHLDLTGAKSHSQTENIAPYSLYGDEGANALTGEALPVGSYELEATAYSQKNKGGNELATLSVSFTVAEAAPTPRPTPTPTPTPTPSPAPTPEPEPLTATFQNAPDAHNGTDTFTFQILFNEAVSTSYQTLEGSALGVQDGEVTNASRVDGRSDLWQIVVRPDSDADVTITLPATQDCDAEGAVCTEDGKKLSGEVSHTVPGPDPEEETTNPLTGFTLVDASDQSVLATLTDGIAVELDDPAGGDYAIRVDVESVSAIGSVHLALTGAKRESRTENVAPYSLYGDEGSNTLSGGTLPVGSYELEATAYSEGDRAGDVLGILAVSFTVTETPPTPVPPTLSARALEDSTGIELSWNRPAENADAVTGYEILRALDGGEMTTLVADTQSKSVAYIDEATESGKTHAYRVKTIMGEQKSGPSNRAEVHVPHDPVDLAPSNLVAETADEGVALTWSAPAEVADSVTGYEILRSVGDGEMTTLVADTQSTALAYTDEDATEGGETYAYLVKAIRGEEKSEASNRAEVQVPHDPVDLAPSNLEAVAIQGGVGLDWDAPDADTESVTGYQILRSASPEVVLVRDTKSDVTEFIDDTALGGTTYTYRVKAIRDGSKSEGANSNTILFVDDDPPVAAPQVSAPELLLVKNTDPRTGDSGILTQANDKIAQVFTTGTNEGGYRITSIGAVANSISQPSPAQRELTATINENGGANPGAVLCTLVNPANFRSVGLETFTAPADCPTLNPSTDYFFVIERTSGTSHISWESNGNNDEDPGGPGDWSIADGRRHLYSGSWIGDDFSHLIEIRGSLLPPALVKNTSRLARSNILHENGEVVALAFTTGPNSGGYRLTSIAASAAIIDSPATTGSEITATLNAASGENPGAALCTLADPITFKSSGPHTFTAPTTGEGACPRLKPRRTYFLVFERTDGMSGIRWATHPSDDEDDGSADGWAIADGYRESDSSRMTWTGLGVSFLIDVRGVKLIGIGELQAKNTDQAKVAEGDIYSLTPGDKAAQAFRTGKDEYGYTLASIAFTFTGVDALHAAMKDVTATLHTQGGDFLPGRLLCTLNNPTWIEANNPSTFTAPADCPTLQPDTVYYFVVERTGNAAGGIKIHGTPSQDEDFANPGWNILGSSARFDGATWTEYALFIPLLEVRALTNFPVTQLWWSGEIVPSCHPTFGSCGYIRDGHDSVEDGGGSLTKSQFNHQGTTYRVKELT